VSKSFNGKLMIFCCLAMIAWFAFLMVLIPRLDKENPKRGVLIQAMFRSNFALFGLPMAESLCGAERMGPTSLLIGVCVPLVNILAVITLETFRGGKPSAKKMLIGIAKNPLIIGVVAGLAVLGIRELQNAAFGRVIFSIQRDTYFVYKVLSNLKTMCTPLALLVLGGQFEFSAVKGLLKEIVSGTVSRIVIAPLIGIGCAILVSANTDWLACGVNEYPALVAMFGSPVAVSSAVMAGNMGSDEQLATQLVVWTSIFSIVTIFAQVCILMGMGLLAV
jgi:predicted permease